MENARKTVQRFINARSDAQIVFTSGTTESLDIVARSWLSHELKPGDRVIVSEFEHHSNFVIWQQLCREKQAEFIVIPEKNGKVDMGYFRSSLNSRTRLVSVTMVSNVTGVRLPVEEIVDCAHSVGAVACIDAAQAVRHGIDARLLGCDFLCFSGHKMMGPSGTGVLFISESLLDQMRPYRFGGGMVDTVTAEESTFSSMPGRMEAGTPNYPGIIGLGAAAEYLSSLGISGLSAYEEQLTAKLEIALLSVDGVTVLGGEQKKYSVVSAVIKGVHPYDAASVLDKYGVAVRAGSHCAQPILRRLGYDSVLRFSTAFYNTVEEIEALEEILSRTIDFFSRH